MIKPSRVQKPSSSGTTHKIRKQLNFTDERRWKQFSCRRLELIEKFGLGERKASEQDKSIRQIATILRTEFGYPLSSSSEFEKLVTAAVQSVRRNRKRSSKTKPTDPQPQEPVLESLSVIPAAREPSVTDNLFFDHDSDQFARTDRYASRSNSSSSPPDSSITSFISHTQTLPTLFSHSSQRSDSTKNTHTISAAPHALPVLQPKPLGSNNKQTRDSKNPSTSIVTAHTQNYDEVIKAVIADMVQNRVALHVQSRNDEVTPNLADFALSSNDGNLLNIAFQSHVVPSSSHTTAYPKARSTSGNNSNESKIPFFLREKILLHVQRSRACLEVSTAQGSLELYTNLSILGETSVKASVAFVMERFFSNLSSSSMEYVTSKLCSNQELALISVRIFGPATERHFDQLPHEAQLKLFYIVIGGIIKDFGFDPCIYPLSEIMHDVILRQFPLGHHPKGDFKRAAVMSTVSMAPAAANKDVYRIVLLKFKDKEQRFTFHLLSNGSPTIAEILANSRSLFHIVSQTKSLYLIHNNKVINDDMELARIFNRFTSEEIVIELHDVKPEPLDGLAMLSTVSASEFSDQDSQRELSNRQNGVCASPPVSCPTVSLPASDYHARESAYFESAALEISSDRGKTVSEDSRVNKPAASEQETKREADQSKETGSDAAPRRRFQPLL
ncbi:LAQU0S09e01068g1_1 [Lachancea quebecensis]|uniref:LAQU0S09e01068g1_1 n=1 Tax=Lachancea quebecensis TaxID=1654605 RepID=A0A0P1L1V2_9SACH|nr:LAQU0S09e01068g1_1 [Lachancea quebecensis]